MTLSPGLAAVHQAILGDRLRLALDTELCAAVTGLPGPLAHPGLVCDVAIGQSTLVTQRVKANLFYRGLTFHRFPVIGDSLYTRTEVVGLRTNSVKPGRAPTGLAALRMITIDQADRLVLDFYRCAMLPVSPDWRPRRPDPPTTCRPSAPTWRRRRRIRPPTGTARPSASGSPGRISIAGLAGAVLHSTADVVSSAPELARLTLNIAAAHHDSRVGGRRLVYGGHTIGLALAQASRLLPNLATVLGWQSCDHTGPVYEGDTLYSELHVESAEPTEPRRRAGVAVAGLRGQRLGGRARRQVLDWRFTALQF